MRHLYSPLSVLAVALAIAPAALAEPEAHARQRLETRGVAIGSVRLSLEGAPSLTVLDLGRPAPATAGSDATGAFDETRYPLTPKRPVPGLAAQLRLREYPARGLTVGLLDYQGPTLAARESVQVVMTLPGYGRGMAITRYNPYWTGPAFASDYRLLPEANTLTLWQRAGKPGYELLVPLAGQGLVGEVGKHQLRFGVTLAGHAPTRPSRLPLFVHASGSDPYGLTRTAYEAGFATAEPYGKLRWQKPYPAVFDRLGWCSWNAYYQRVDEAKLLESAASLRAKGLPIGFMLIDDGWMQLAGQQLKGHGAEPGKFPHGLKWLSDRIKRTHGIPHVGVWHTLQGYWEGVAPASAATEGHRLFAGLDGQVLPDPRDAAGKSFYDAWYGELANAGIDFIKVDGQANNARMTDGLLPRLASAEGSHRALQEAAAARFGLGPGAGALPMLNCMSLAVEHAYSWRHANLVRTSNDYDPDQPLTSKEHVLQNAYNAYWAANFAFPDYDMFESHRPDAAYHAIARAISGGPSTPPIAPGARTRRCSRSSRAPTARCCASTSRAR